jgi:alpha-galactosidase
MTNDTTGVAATPPMGWNSWDCFGNSVTEAEVLANAEFLATEMAPSGWDTVVVDIQWHDPDATGTHYNPEAALVLDSFGRPIPAVNRFPSAAGGAGFAPLADRVHALGLKFGLHIMRGIPRLAVERGLPVAGTSVSAADIADTSSVCDWNTDNYGIDHARSGASGYYESVIQLFAAWGVDFVKVDDMIGPFRAEEVAAFSAAVARSPRPMVLSLSPGRSLSTVHAETLAQMAQMWRISADLWDRWSDIEHQFERLALWAPVAGPGTWPDADMIPFGHIGIRAEEGPDRMSRLTSAEQRTLMTLWCFAKSPLMVGSDLPTSDREVIELLTDRELLDIHRFGANQRQLLREGGLVVWATVDSRDGSAHFAVFNLTDASIDYAVPAASLGIQPDAVDGATDRVWGKQWSGVLPAHGCATLHVASPLQRAQPTLA